MDESYASTFNEVDLCLRVRESGRAVILSARTTLILYESLFSGRPASPEETGFPGSGGAAGEGCPADTPVLAPRLADDPCHDPNLSLQRGNEAGLAVPPRVARPPISDPAEAA
jgi:hypothetical protein